MTSREFVEKAINGEFKRFKRVSSLMYDPDYNTVYSYGYHYPLCFQINGQWLRNDRGYSVTTSKHIGLCPNDYTFSLNPHLTPTRENIALSINEELIEISETLKALSPRAFRQKEILLNRREAITKTLKIVR